MTFPAGGTEFGGRPGRVQPPPHDPANSASETLHALYATDEGEETSTPEGVIKEWLDEGKGRR